jgi:hypothetical protein
VRFPALGAPDIGPGPAASSAIADRAAYSITSSARASSIGCISESSAFAVARLIAKLNLVAISTGRSAFLTLENAANIDADAAIGVRYVGSIAHQTANFNVIGARIGDTYPPPSRRSPPELGLPRATF